MANPDPRYSAAHDHVRTTFGPASRWPCVLCHQPADDWAMMNDSPRAQRSGGYRWSEDPGDYMPLCDAHHRQYDVTWRRWESAETEEERARIMSSVGVAGQFPGVPGVDVASAVERVQEAGLPLNGETLGEELGVPGRTGRRYLNAYYAVHGGDDSRPRRNPPTVATAEAILSAVETLKAEDTDVTGDALAQRLGVSGRTGRRYLEALRVVGEPCR